MTDNTEQTLTLPEYVYEMWHDEDEKDHDGTLPFDKALNNVLGELMYIEMESEKTRARMGEPLFDNPYITHAVVDGELVVNWIEKTREAWDGFLMKAAMLAEVTSVINALSGRSKR